MAVDGFLGRGGGGLLALSGETDRWSGAGLRRPAGFGGGGGDGDGLWPWVTPLACWCGDGVFRSGGSSQGLEGGGSEKSIKSSS